MVRNKILAAGLLLFSAFAANATIIPIADRATFDSVAGATTLLDFEAQQTGPRFTYYGGSLTIGDVTFTQGDNSLYVFASNFFNTRGTSSYLNNNNGPAPVVVNFAADVFSIGMDMAWLSNFGEADDPSTMTILLSTGDSFVQTVVGPLAGSSTSMGFVGFYSDLAFTSMTILDGSDSVMLDNFAYGTSAISVPEPGTLALFGVGLFGLAAARRKRAQTA